MSRDIRTPYSDTQCGHGYGAEAVRLAKVPSVAAALGGAGTVVGGLVLTEPVDSAPDVVSSRWTRPIRCHRAACALPR